MLAPGCGTSAVDRVTLVSTSSRAELPARPSTRVYGALDRNTADFYLTDLPESASAPGADLRSYTGHLIHVHLFIAPKAGSTPIAPGASTVTVRHIVLAGGEMGMYAGGGFMTPSDTIGSAESGGRISGATLRLAGATPGFVDRLGPSEMAAAFSATRDEARARAWSAAFSAATASLRQDPTAGRPSE